MKISTLRKIYPYIREDAKNIKWRNLTDTEIEAAMAEPQKICNCFNSASRYALFSSRKGREILKNRIKIQKGVKSDPAYKFKFTINDKDEIYRVDREDYFKRFFKIFRRYSESEHYVGEFLPSPSNNFNMAVDMAVSKMIKKHPTQKGLFLRIFRRFWASNMRCEYNRPSRAFEWLTGKSAEKIGEDGLFKTLKDYPKQTEDLLNSLGNDYSYILLSGNKKIKDVKKWHCLPIIRVIPEERTVELLNKRDGSIILYNFDDLIKDFKAIVGIRWN